MKLAPMPAAAPAAAPTHLVLADLNCQNLYPVGDATGGTPPTADEFRVKLAKLAHAVHDELHNPDVIALEEIGNPAALASLLAQTDLGAQGYKSLIEKSNDKRNINVAILYNTNTVEVDAAKSVNPPRPAGLPDSHGQVDGSVLFARPPLVVDLHMKGAAQAREGVQQLELVVNHFHAKPGGDDATKIRDAQGAWVGGFVDAQRAANPNRPVIVLGDLNSGYGETAYENIEKHADGTARMFDAPMKVDAANRYSYEFKGQHSMLDHMLVTPDLVGAISSVNVPHFNTGDWDPNTHRPTHGNDPSTAAGVSDHDPVETTFDLSKLGTGAPAPAPKPAR